jgi:RNA 2',3'-cyclic 3'-phosphodiesterase
VLDAVDALPRPELSGVRWTGRDQWHVTLRFLGDADAADVRSALGCVEAPVVEAQVGPAVKRLGRGVLCIPVSGLDAVAAAVIDATRSIGRPPEHRDFRGHLTLARVNGRMPHVSTGIDCRWTVATFDLVRSHLGGGPARYETLATWPLQP